MSTSSNSKPEFPIGSQIGKFQVLSELGSGGFGTVYKVRLGKFEGALKAEFPKHKSSGILKEIEILRLVRGCSHFCELFAAKKTKIDGKIVHYMIITLCGKSLSELRRMTPNRRFTISTGTRLSYQLLEAIRYLHSIGIIHRDIKGSNCAINPSNRQLILFDLGICRKYLKKNEKTQKLEHAEPRKNVGFIGTTKYASIFVHDNKDQSRRDDLWAWFYTTIEFYHGSLPWSCEEETHLIYRQKCLKNRILFKKSPREIMKIYRHICSLKFNSCPNYKMIFKQFENVMIRREIEWDQPYDFEPESEYFDQYFSKNLDEQQKIDQNDKKPKIDVTRGIIEEIVTNLFHQIDLTEVTLSSTKSSSTA